MEGESFKEQYSNLKKKVCAVAYKQPFTLQQVKDFFKKSINSNRLLSRASNLDSIFSLLEDRDLLNERNVSALHCLGQLLNNPEITTTVGVYSKFFLNDSDATCNLCGLSCSYEEILDSQSDIQQNQVSNLNNNNNNNTNSNYVDELGEALKNVSLRIGEQWKTLARYLDLDEWTIDEICRNNPNNLVGQAQVALTIWRQRTDASISALDNALEQRYCKKKGLGTHLRKPLVNSVEVICLSS